MHFTQNDHIMPSGAEAFKIVWPHLGCAHRDRDQ